MVYYETFLKEQMTLPTRLLTMYKKLELTETEFSVIVHLMRFQSVGITFPTPTEIAKYTSIDETMISQILRRLMQKDLITIKEMENGDGIVDEYYSFEPLLKKLYDHRDMTSNKPTEDSVTLFRQFEREFGRTLSPIEIETINIWLDDDKYAVSLILQALREAVLLSKLNFKYIDRILQEWQKKGVKTEKDAKKASQQYRKNQPQAPTPKNHKTVERSFYYNWLDEKD